MSIRSLMISSSKRRELDKVKILSIINPVPGTSGIYQIVDDAGKTFPAYVDMATDGGYWILVARWTGWVSSTMPQNKISFRQSIMKDQAIAGFSNNPASFPAIPAGKISKNPAKQWSLRSANSSWTSLFGAWQRGSTIEGDIVHGVGLPVVTSIGNKTLHGPRTGWFQNSPVDSGFGFWTVSGNNGHCGGSGRAGTNTCCPVMAFSSEGYGVHADGTALKQLFIRATNFPQP